MHDYAALNVMKLTYIAQTYKSMFLIINAVNYINVLCTKSHERFWIDCGLWLEMYFQMSDKFLFSYYHFSIVHNVHTIYRQYTRLTKSNLSICIFLCGPFMTNFF